MFSQKEVQSFLNMNKKSHDYIYEACVYSLHQSSEDLTLDKGKEAMVSSASVHISKKKTHCFWISLDLNRKQLELMEILQKQLRIININMDILLIRVSVLISLLSVIKLNSLGTPLLPCQPP